MTADQTLDLRGLKCPLPALMAKRAMARSTPQTILEVIADDPLAHIDVPHMCAAEAIQVLATQRDGDVIRLWLRRA